MDDEVTKLLDTIVETPSNRNEAVVEMSNGKRPQLKSRWARDPKREYFHVYRLLLTEIISI